MKKDIGSVIALYPTPTTIVGTVIEGKVNLGCRQILYKAIIVELEGE